MATFPILKKAGSVVVKVYRVKHKTAAGGCAYTMAWIDPGERRKTRQFGDLEKAREEAQTKANLLARGIVDSEGASRGDLMELAEARRLAGPGGLAHALSKPLANGGLKSGEWHRQLATRRGRQLASCGPEEQRTTPHERRRADTAPCARCSTAHRNRRAIAAGSEP